MGQILAFHRTYFLLFKNFIALWRHLAKTQLLSFIHIVQIDLSITADIAEVHQFPRSSLMEFQNICNEIGWPRFFAPPCILTPDFVEVGQNNDGDPRFNLGTPLAHLAIAWDQRRVFGTSEARNFKFGTQIDLSKSHISMTRYPQTGRGQGSRAKFILELSLTSNG